MRCLRIQRGVCSREEPRQGELLIAGPEGNSRKSRILDAFQLWCPRMPTAEDKNWLRRDCQVPLQGACSS